MRRKEATQIASSQVVPSSGPSAAKPIAATRSTAATVFRTKASFAWRSAMQAKSRISEQATATTPTGRRMKTPAASPSFSAGIRVGRRTAAIAPPTRLTAVTSASPVETVSDQSRPAERDASRETKTWPMPRFVKTETKSIADTNAEARPTSSAERMRAATIQKPKPSRDVTAVVPMM
jgi:hypothetical protein